MAGWRRGHNRANSRPQQLRDRPGRLPRGAIPDRCGRWSTARQAQLVSRWLALDVRAPKLLEGAYDFLSGLHHEPYYYRAKGDKRFVYLAQAQNDWDDRFVVGDAVKSVKDLVARAKQQPGKLNFGSSGVGDPACDVAIAWTFFYGASRERFRAQLALDDATWARGRGWALWKALITLQKPAGDASLAARRMGWRISPRQLVEEVLADL